MLLFWATFVPKGVVLYSMAKAALSKYVELELPFTYISNSKYC